MTSDAQPVAGMPFDRHRASRMAWPIAGVALLLLAGAAIFLRLNSAGVSDMVFLVAIVSFAVMGALIAAHRPGNRIGWLLLAGALCYSAFTLMIQYALYGSVHQPGQLPLIPIATWLAAVLVQPGLVISLVLLPLHFPDGRLPSPRWRPVRRCFLAFMAASMAYNAMRPGDVQGFEGLANPFPVAAIEPVTPVIDALLLAGWLASVCTGAASLIVRLRRSSGVERQQLKWLMYAVLVCAALLLLTLPAEVLVPDLYWLLEVLLALSFAGVPVAVGIAVLHYRLYDIDLLINRTLVYGVLTGCVITLYALLVGYLGALFRVDNNPLISIAATGIIAVLFQPLHAWLQRGVNRLLYGERDDPYTVLARLGQRLETTLTPEIALPTIVETVAQALHLPYAAIALGADDTGGLDEQPATSAVYGKRPDPPHAYLASLPLIHQDEHLGILTVAPRIGERELSARDRRLLDDLVRQAGVAIHAASLAADLRRSRESVVAAREEERRRLRRDLHDGLGPVLATLVVQAEAARELLADEPAAARELLADVTSQAQGAIADVRRLVYGLRPPALDDLGLVGALRAYAARHVHGETQLRIDAPDQLPPLPAAVEVAAYRLVQEAMTNVLRHAGARHCVVTLAVAGLEGRRALAIEVRDDGIGLPWDRSAGVGLTAMHERAAEVGGTFQISSVDGRGTRISACLPI